MPNPTTQTTQTLKMVSCTPDCGFVVRSHDEREVLQTAVNHARNAHGKTVSEKDMRSSMRTTTVGSTY